MFTQRDEEQHILKFFRANKTGRFLDIGAYDGECFSTTRALALRGWGGVCVEPSPSVLPALHKRYDGTENIEILEVAISTASGPITFFDSNGDMISSTDLKHVELWRSKAGVVFKQIKVNAVTPKNLFSDIGYEFDFVSLDVEGINIDMFGRFPFEKLSKVKMFCVEFDLHPEEILKLAEPHGFTLLHQTAENLLLTR